MDHHSLEEAEQRLLAKWRKEHPSCTEEELQERLEFLRDYADIALRIFERLEKEKQAKGEKSQAN